MVALWRNVRLEEVLLECGTFPFDLYSDVVKQLFSVRKMDTMYDAAVFAAEACDKVHGCRGHQHTPCLQRKIAEYFVNGTEVDVPKRIGGSSSFLTADIKVFLQCNSHAKFTPGAIARILHGIASPAFPYAIWSRTHFWGMYMQTDFKAITEAAMTELMNLVGRDAL
ncbi:hypothetical protein T459_27713 [Capsicum annuum]|uniref:Uncharacterized protein n=1 Tax=Capsicum annuum TaxID=4072 RepID=A0A2G2YER0_CAPAN|nr:hypothetical protein T459_27713 [Capsicum annuum]